MCGHEHGEHRHGRRHGYGHARRGAFGFGRGGFPAREEWLERLEGYQQHLEQELANVRELIERLGPSAPTQAGNV